MPHTLATLEVKGVKEFMGAIDSAPEVIAVKNHVAMREAVALVKRSALDHVHRDGRKRLKVNYTTKSTGFAVEGRVSTNWVGNILERGAMPHEITARDGGMLAFAAGGRPGGTGGVIYAKRVFHPGVHDKQFLLPALVNNVVPIELIFRRVADELVRHLAD